MSRIEMQEKIDKLYAEGKITREEWSNRFDELSSSKWTASGLVEKKKLASDWDEHI